MRVSGRNRVLLDRHPVARTRDLLGALRVTVFAPDDLVLVKGGPSGRRDYLDDLLVAAAPRYDAVRGDYERVVRHRNALLKGGVRDAEARTTLEVFDEQLVEAGAELVAGRLRLLERLTPAVGAAYQALAGTAVAGRRPVRGGMGRGRLAAARRDREVMRGALEARRRQEIDRKLTLVGPHRDEWRLRLAEFDSRTQASQGEQRTLALALRLAGHRVCAEVLDDEPVLLLDDVFSELDAERSDALVAELPAGQTVITTAGAVPDAVHPERRVRGRRAGRAMRSGRGRPDGVPGEEREPMALGDAVAAVGAELGLPSPHALDALSGRWPELVGPALAAHARVRSLRAGVLTIAVDDAPWATELRYLHDQLRARFDEVMGADVVREVRVVVERVSSCTGSRRPLETPLEPGRERRGAPLSAQASGRVIGVVSGL